MVDQEKSKWEWLKHLIERNKNKSPPPTVVKETVRERDDSSSSRVGNHTLSLALVFLGLLHFGIKHISPELVTISFAFSLGLFMLGGYALAAKLQKDRITILIPMLLFSVWYFVYGSSVDPKFLIGFISVSGLLLAIPLFLTKGESAKPELVGLLPVLFLFLDIGLLPFLIEKFHLPLTLFMESAVLFVPWWALFGV